MNAKTQTTKPADEKLLRDLDPRERDLVERVMAQHPALTAAEAIEALREAGM